MNELDTLSQDNEARIATLTNDVKTLKEQADASEKFQEDLRTTLGVYHREGKVVWSNTGAYVRAPSTPS